MHNGLFWSRHFQAVYSEQLRAVGEAVRPKLLPPFDGISDEADTIAEMSYHRIGSSPSSDSMDMEDAAEMAPEESLGYYELMSRVKQGIANLLAASTYHLLGQQFLTFHRQELLEPSEAADPSAMTVAEGIARLKQIGIDVTGFGSWREIDELRHVANTVKHADGDSCEHMKRLRPEMFSHPSLPGNYGLKWTQAQLRTPVYMPLAGDDFFVATEDLGRYIEAAHHFWDELCHALEAIG